MWEGKFVLNDVVYSEILSFVYQWFHKLTPPCFVLFFILRISFKTISFVLEYFTHRALNENLFIKSFQTTQYGIRSLLYTGTNLWKSLPVTIKQIAPLSRSRKTMKKNINSYNNITSF